MGICKGLKENNRFTYFKFISQQNGMLLVWSYKEFIQIHMFYCFMLFETWSLVCLGRDTADKRVNGNKKKHHESCNISWVTNAIIITLSKKENQLPAYRCKFLGCLGLQPSMRHFTHFQRVIDLSVPFKKNFSLGSNFMGLIRNVENILVMTKCIFPIWNRIL